MSAAYKRFPVPAFDRDALKALSWHQPAYLSEAEAARLAAGHLARTAAAAAHVVKPGPALLARLGLGGEQAHAVLCLLPDAAVTAFGRSHAWPLQQAWLLDRLDADATILAAWNTPRPMNTRLGPEAGLRLDRGAVYVLCAHRQDGGWIGNRSLARVPAGADGGMAVLSCADAGNDFHHCNVYFAW